jgi:hypothetical protein
MLRCLTRFPALLTLATVMAGMWWFWPAGSAVRQIPHPADAFDFATTDCLEVFANFEELRQAYPLRGAWVESQVDWQREKIARVRFLASGYRTDRGAGQPGLSEIQFGQPSASARFGGRTVRFFLHQPTPYLFGGPIHNVFEQRQQIAWFAMPKSAETQLVSEATITTTDTVFLLGLAALLGTGFAARRKFIRSRTDDEHKACSVDDELHNCPVDSYDAPSDKGGELTTVG